MKNNLKVLILILITVLFFSVAIFSQTNEFSYQGSLNNAAAPANGNYDFEFALYDAVSGGSQVGSTLTRASVAVTSGDFSVKLDFGSQFPGANRFLEIRVRQTGGGAYTPLAPRQQINSTPYSVQSLNATNATQLGGIAANQYVLTGDPRMSNARMPTANSTNYIQNIPGIGTQANASFNISGSGNANIFNANTQFNIGGNRVLGIEEVGSNTFVGINAGNGGCCNVFVGYSAGSNNTTGSFNSFFGQAAGRDNTMGSFNSFFGDNAGVENDTGFSNTFVGMNSGQSNTNENYNVFIGFNSNGAAAITNATAIGTFASVIQSNSIVLGSINGVNGATADTKVGIGTSAPEQQLHVVGTEILSTGSGAGFKFRDRGSASPGDDWVWYSNGNIARFFRTGSGDLLTVQTNGNVGIGTTAPTFKLTIFDSLNTGLRVTTAGSGGTVASFGSNGAFQVDAAGIAGGRFNVAQTGEISFGTVGSAGGIPLCRNLSNQISHCSSSARYKSNINPFNSGLSLIKQLRPVYFNWKDGGMPDMGLVAEDVAAIEPLLTTTNAKGEIEGVKYDRVGVVLINAVKEQQTQIEAQQKQIDEQKMVNRKQEDTLKRQQLEIDELRGLVCAQNSEAQICKPRY